MIRVAAQFLGNEVPQPIRVYKDAKHVMPGEEASKIYKGDDLYVFCEAPARFANRYVKCFWQTHLLRSLNVSVKLRYNAGMIESFKESVYLVMQNASTEQSGDYACDILLDKEIQETFVVRLKVCKVFFQPSCLRLNP